MFEIISNPFENVGESLSGLAIEKAIEVVTPSTSKGFGVLRMLLILLLLVFGVFFYIIFYYLPKQKREEEDVEGGIE
ncbi:hypothetical protein [Flectobacillus major]|uniref:hypothetical protein n=1 Tax=Flectobacillus major TaxID=103 RepID=UPI0005C47995|nr:hypothetical protein [Flectobacillus major]